jgi:threonine/homoserine efflux transporter RhtA
MEMVAQLWTLCRLAFVSVVLFLLFRPLPRDYHVASKVRLPFEFLGIPLTNMSSVDVLGSYRK